MSSDPVSITVTLDENGYEHLMQAVRGEHGEVKQ